MNLPQLAVVEAAIARLGERLRVVQTECLPIAQTVGRILAEPLSADRGSPPLDISAMDGYAVMYADVGQRDLPVVATTVAGTTPTTCMPGTAVRIFTGAPIPAGADCVVRREDTDERENSISVRVDASSIKLGQNIRRQGENVRASGEVLPAGTELNSVAMAAVASFGPAQIAVHRRVRVAILNTGDELTSPGAAVAAWQIRDSNGPTLDAWLRSLPWVDLVARLRVEDDFASVQRAIASHAATCDAVILTGGVSMGDTDYVPGAIESLGGEIVFHRLPIRPGKPILGGSLNRTLLLGLPGNPVSVAVTARVFGLPLLSKLAGRQAMHGQPHVEVANADEKCLPLVWYRLITIDESGRARLIDSQGSGDLVSLARSAGFITLPAGQAGPGPWQLTLW